MLRKSVWFSVPLVLLCCVLQLCAQQAASTDSVVPSLVRFSGILAEADGKPLTGTLGATFSLYKDQTGGAPLWLETQNVQAEQPRTLLLSVPYALKALDAETLGGKPASAFMAVAGSGTGSGAEARQAGPQVEQKVTEAPFRRTPGMPYRFMRHPIYTGHLLMGLGTAIASGLLVGFAGLASFVAGFWIKLNQEERLLLRGFPDEYPAYKARVKALIPYVL